MSKLITIRIKVKVNIFLNDKISLFLNKIYATKNKIKELLHTRSRNKFFPLFSQLMFAPLKACCNP